MMPSRVIVKLLGLVITCAAIAGCGDGQSTDQQVFLESHRLDLLLADCSPSFRQSSERFIPEMVLIAQDSAAQRRALWVGCFDGAPLRTLIWKPRVDFGNLPPSLSNNDRLADRFNQARALGLEPN